MTISATEQLKEFLADYERYALEVLKPTEREIRALFKSWTASDLWTRKPVSRLPTPSPIHWTRTRIKRPESVVDKILNQPVTFPEGLTLSSLRTMNDPVAGRVVVYFLSNLPQLHYKILTEDSLEISRRSPPIAFLSEELATRLGLTDIKRVTKESGYASIHYIVRLKKSIVLPELRPWFEIQVRTLTEHAWGEIEHILGYKPGKQTSFAVRKQFQIISTQLTAIDEHFNLLLEELSRYQEEVQFTDSSTLNAENLPAVLSALGTGCAQNEIGALLSLLGSRGIDKVGQLRSVASTTHMEIIRNTYLKSQAKPPENFEVVASLAAINGIKSESEIVKAIEVQIRFLETWSQLKKTNNHDDPQPIIPPDAAR